MQREIRPEDIAYGNLQYFSEYAWKDDPEHVPNGDFQNEWYDLLQPDDRPKRLHIQWPREHAKTTCTSVKYVIWRLGRDHNLRVLIVSKSASLATNILREIKRNIEENDRIHRVFPDLQPDTPWSDVEIQVKRDRIQKDPSVRGVGLHGSLTGARADILILDDPFDEENIQTLGQRAKVENWIEKVSFTVVGPKGEIICIGTRWHHADYWGTLMEKTDDDGNHLFERRIYQAIENPQDELDDWRVLWPEKWSPERLYIRRLEIGRLRFNCLYQNDPSGYEGVLFREQDLAFYDPDKAISAHLGDLDFYMGVDPSISEEPTADYFAVARIAVDRKLRDVYVLDIYAKRIGFPAQVQQIDSLFRGWIPYIPHEAKGVGIRKVGIESIAYQRALAQQTYSMGLPVVQVQHSKRSKIQRMIGLQPHFENGRIKFPNPETHRTNWFDAFKEEYLSFPRGRHDDRLDALQIAFEIAGVVSSGSSIPFGPGGSQRPLMDWDRSKRSVVMRMPL